MSARAAAISGLVVGALVLGVAWLFDVSVSHVTLLAPVVVLVAAAVAGLGVFWYRAAADEKGVALSDPEAREIVYGMPYDEWRKQHQKEATAEQKAAFAASQPKHARIG